MLSDQREAFGKPNGIPARSSLSEGACVMGTLYIGRILAMQMSLGLKDPQIAKLNALLKADDSLSTQAARLESVRIEINALLRQKSLDAKKLEELRAQSATLEKNLHENASRLNEQVRGILDPTQFNTVERSLKSADVPKPRPPVIIPPIQFPPPAGNTWEGMWPISGHVDTSWDGSCVTIGPSGPGGWAGPGAVLVPYCYQVDFSRGASGGYTLNVIDSQGAQGPFLLPITVSSTIKFYTIGFYVSVSICGQPFWAASGWYDATLTLYGIRICDNPV